MLAAVLCERLAVGSSCAFAGPAYWRCLRTPVEWSGLGRLELTVSQVQQQDSERSPSWRWAIEVLSSLDRPGRLHAHTKQNNRTPVEHTRQHERIAACQDVGALADYRGSLEVN